ncbi:ribosome small subunit-dependent GTPase A [Enterococcus timonensis]|uniref:ribosome small subunit-dependent GTPase A n=1 Tax=Enterococcus timonensis TaxID=1852364 RepID=UPI0008D9347E|nr:ribosome small subunit-dependent GTPase A [Enterococcus timonensis]
MTKGIIIFQAQGIYKVILDAKEIVTGRLKGNLLKERSAMLGGMPVVGDFVQGEVHDTDQFLITEILERKSFLQRKIAGSRQDQQGIAANIDTVFITTSANHEFNLARLERFVTIVWDSGAMPVIVLTKTDLAQAGIIAQQVEKLSEFFIGLPIITTGLNEEITEKFSAYLSPEKIVTFIGSSGVGKSTLLNQFIQENAQVTQDIRNEDAHGRHTTTSRELFVLENGAMIIDTPGMREVGLDTVSAAALEQSFEQITGLAKMCRFNNCQHKTEPGCAVKEAINNGELSDELFKNYLKMQKQLQFLQKKEMRKKK